MSTYELAQLNIGIIRGPMDSPVMAEFAANLDRVNALAESSPGFVWRLQTADGNATAIRPFENVNEAILVLWWVPRGHRPSVEEAIARLELLRRKGPHPEAFTFRETYPPPDAQASERPGGFEDECPAT